MYLSMIGVCATLNKGSRQKEDASSSIVCRIERFCLNVRLLLYQTLRSGYFPLSVKTIAKCEVTSAYASNRRF